MLSENADQREVEELMVSLGVQRYTAGADKNLLSQTLHGSSLLSSTMTDIEAVIIEWLKAAAESGAGRSHHCLKYLSQVDPGIAAYLACRITLDKITVGKDGERAIAWAIGAAIEEEAHIQAFMAVNHVPLSQDSHL